MPPLRLFLIDDHPLVGAGLRQMLALHADLLVVAEARDGPSALQQVAQVAPDVALCDLSLPGMDGLELIRQLRRHYPPCAIIILTMQEDDEAIFDALRAGAAAFATKAISGEDLVHLIRQVGAGTYVINEQVFERPRVATHMLEAFRQLSDVDAGEGTVFAAITPREAEILASVARGYSNKEIARLLSISDQTVKNHMTSILRKLAVNDRTQAVLYALRHGWITLADTRS